MHSLRWRLTSLGVLLALTGCANDTPAASSSRWVLVARDANYQIFIDTGRIGRYGWRSYDVWYRTDHAMERLHKGDDKPFNREVVHSIVDCDSLRFKVMSVDMSMGNERPIVEQRLTTKEVMWQKWRPVELGAAEEIAARAACHYASKTRVVKR